MELHKSLYKIMLKGLSLVLPVALAIYVIVWLARSVDGILKNVIIYFLPSGSYIPGMGLLVMLVIVFFAGLLMYPWLTKTFMKAIDKQLRKIPLFGSVYSPTKDLVDLFGEGMDEKLGKPVMIKIPNTDVETLGFVTRENNKDLPEGFIPDGYIVVYVQWSSQAGGYCFVVPEDSVRELGVSVEDGLRWALTAGISGPKREEESKEKN